MNKYLVIGGSGFIGSCFLNNYTNSSNIFNYDKNQSPFFPKITIIGNILDIEKLNNSLKDYFGVILLAAEHKDDITPTSLYYDVNVQGTKNVLNAMDINGIKNLIFTSSVAVYGINKKNPNEDSDLNPFNHYGKSKKQAEEVIYNWYSKDSKNKSITIIRPTVVFGIRNRGNVYNLINLISKKHFIMIGNGKNIKSICYVENLVSFINQCKDKCEIGYKIYNYVDKPDLSTNELIRIIKTSLGIRTNKFYIPYKIGLIGGYFFDLLSFILNKKMKVSSIRIKKFSATTQFDSSKLHLVFDPPYSLKESLIKTINYEFINKNNDDIEFFTE